MSSVVEAPPAAEPTVEAVIDLEALLAPIPGDNPSGANLQYSGLHDEIREARRSDDNLDQGEWKREQKVADWEQVIELSTNALATQTKDFRISSWLAEAIAKEYGFPGLRDGLRLTRELHERFWETIYPEIDEGDMEARANALSWMDRQLAIALKEVPITKSPTGLNYSYLDWEDSKRFDIPENVNDDMSSEELGRISGLREQAAEEGKVTSEAWRISKNATRRAFYEETFALLNECWAEFQALDRVMDEKFDRQTPGLGVLKKSLDEVRSGVERLLKEKRLLEPDPVSAEAGSEGSGAEGAGEDGATGDGFFGGGTVGPIKGRQDALRRLAEVAEYFRRTEPHSPVSYLVQRAIKWGQMPLEQWLGDVVKNDGVLEALRETLGLNTSSNTNSNSE